MQTLVGAQEQLNNVDTHCLAMQISEMQLSFIA